MSRLFTLAAIVSTACVAAPTANNLDEHCAQVYRTFAEQMAREAPPGTAIHNIKLGDECAYFTGPTLQDESSDREEADQ